MVVVWHASSILNIRDSGVQNTGNQHFETALWTLLQFVLLLRVVGALAAFAGITQPWDFGHLCRGAMCQLVEKMSKRILWKRLSLLHMQTSTSLACVILPWRSLNAIGVFSDSSRLLATPSDWPLRTSVAIPWYFLLVEEAFQGEVIQVDDSKSLDMALVPSGA